MKPFLNAIKNDYLIKITDNCEFAFLEENLHMESPVESYYFKYDDLSINLSIRLKWSLYGYYFFKSILEALDEEEYIENLGFEGSLQPTLHKTLKQKKVLLLDEIEVINPVIFKNEMEREYTQIFYIENSHVHFKLKVNVHEFIWLNHALVPKLVYVED